MKFIILIIILASCKDLDARLKKASFCGQDKNSLLKLASRTGDNNEVIRLIKDGADVNFEDSWYWTPLMYACWMNKPETAKLLVQNGALIDVPTCSEETMLMYFCSSELYGNKEAIEILVDLGAEINYEDKHGYTPLSSAIVHHKNESIDLLIERGADINYVNKRGSNILSKAIISECEKVIKLILEQEGALDKPSNLNALCLLFELEQDGVLDKQSNLNALGLLIRKDKKWEEIILKHLFKDDNLNIVLLIRTYIENTKYLVLKNFLVEYISKNMNIINISNIFSLDDFTFNQRTLLVDSFLSLMENNKLKIITIDDILDLKNQMVELFIEYYYGKLNSVERYEEKFLEKYEGIKNKILDFKEIIILGEDLVKENKNSK